MELPETSPKSLSARQAGSPRERTSPSPLEKVRDEVYKNPGILFLTLKIFSATGGIEKVCRVAGKALYETTCEWQQNFSILSMHDKNEDANNIYFPAKNLRGFNGAKSAFVYRSIVAGAKSRIVILSHINLLLVGWLIKLIAPKTKLVLIAHGIEVWRPIPGWKKKILRKTDIILSISRFTKEKMKSLYQLQEEKFTILNNCLDPFLPDPPSTYETEALRKKYGFGNNDFIMLTLSRLSETEKNKGYDKVLCAMAELIKKYSNLRYLFVGKYDEAEKKRLDMLIGEYALSGSVVFAGYVPDAELAAHYSLGDVYVMPSEKEGFGISFIEAIHYGVPVIAGNRDGTTDALCDGALGTLIDPRSQEEITNAIKKVLENKGAFAPDRKLLEEKFSYSVYKKKLQDILGKLEIKN